MPNTSERRRKPPMAKVMTVAEFHERFGTQQACLARLKELRWDANLERFSCPACGHAQGWWLPKRELVECRDCHHQVSVTAGTVFHRLRSPLWKWFWAAYQLAQDKKGIAALELAKQIGVSYTTAWLMLHKLRRAMGRRNDHYVLSGLVEVDECYVGGETEGTKDAPALRGRGAENKTAVGVAIELDEAGKPRRVAMDTLTKVDGHSLRKFAEKRIAKGATLRTDGWGAYRSVAKVGYRHQATVTGSGVQAIAKFPWIHTFIGNMKRMILGTHHSVSPKHLANYLAEFGYRANRRWTEAALFDRLLIAAVCDKAVTYKQLVTGDS